MRFGETPFLRVLFLDGFNAFPFEVSPDFGDRIPVNWLRAAVSSETAARMDNRETDVDLEPVLSTILAIFKGRFIFKFIKVIFGKNQSIPGPILIIYLKKKLLLLYVFRQNLINSPNCWPDTTQPA